MVRLNEVRAGELQIDLPARTDAELYFGGSSLIVRGLDCLDGAPLIDVKPDRTLFKPLAPAQAGDFQVGDKT